MSKLLEQGPNALTQLRSTNMFDASIILKQPTEEAKKLATQTGMDEKPVFTTWANTQDEANRHNYAIQATIRAKGGTADVITSKVGSDITDAVLCNADGNNNKGVNEYTLYDVLQAATQGAICPNMNEILSQKGAVINHRFNCQSQQSHLLRYHSWWNQNHAYTPTQHWSCNS